MFLEILHNSQENNCARDSFLRKLQASATALLKKRLWHRCFHLNFHEISKNTIFTEHLRGTASGKQLAAN